MKGARTFAYRAVTWAAWRGGLRSTTFVGSWPARPTSSGPGWPDVGPVRLEARRPVAAYRASFRGCPPRNPRSGPETGPRLGLPCPPEPRNRPGWHRWAQVPPVEALAGREMPAEPATVALVVDLAARGYTRHAIAGSLNARKVPTRSGRGQWWPCAVREILEPGWRATYQRGYRAREDWGR